MAEEFKKLPSINVADLDQDLEGAVEKGEASKKQTEAAAKQERDRLEIGYYNATRKFRTVENVKKRDEMKESLEYQMGFIENLEDAKDIEQSNQQWYNESARQISRIGGADAGQRLNELGKYLRIANEKGLRIAEDKSAQNARDSIEEKQRVFQAELAKPNNLNGIKTAADELQGVINLYDTANVLDDDEVKGYRQRYGRVASGNIWNTLLGTNEYTQATAGSEKALQELKQFKTQFKDYYDALPDKNKAQIENRLKNLKKTENIFPRLQYEYSSALENFNNGRIKIKDFKERTKGMAAKSRALLNSDQLTAEGKIKVQQFIDQVDSIEKTVGALEGLSTSIESGAPLSQKQKSIFDTSKSTAEVANDLGISTKGRGFEFFREMRLDLLKNTYVDGDPVETNKQIYKYLKSIGGAQKSSFNFGRPSSDPIKNFERMLAEDVNVNVAMGGNPGQMSKKTADEYMRLYNDPRNQERLNELSRRYPQLRPMIAKHRSKEQNYFDQGTQGIFNYFGGVLNVNQQSVQATITELSQNPKSKALYNRILDNTATYLDADGKKQLDEVLRDTPFSRSDVLKALSLGVYKRLKEKDNGAISDSTLRSQLESKDTQTYRDVRKYTIEVLKEMSEGKKTIGRVPTWGNDSLNQDSDASRNIIGVFSGRPTALNRGLNTLGRAFDIGKKDMTTLDPAGQRQLNSYLSGLMGQDRPNLQDHTLKLTHESGTLYAIGIDREDGSTDPLKDKFGNKIFIDTDKIDHNKKVTNKSAASDIISIIRKSNVSDAL